MSHASTNFSSVSPATRISGPFAHKSLSVFFLHDESRNSAVPLTLNEALLDKTLRVEETGNIHALSIENFGKSDVFVQAGDLVKGGRQDRVLGVSMVVPAKSGRVPIAAYCVESGRWGRRGYEDTRGFTSSLHAFFSPRARTALRRAAMSFDPAARRFADSEYAGFQRNVWDEVASAQSGLAAAVNRDVRAANSPTSLDLTLEQAQVQAARDDYLKLLAKAGVDDPSITGTIFAMNGSVRTGEIYPWNGLFHKMWDKNLSASIMEAVRTGSAAQADQPSPEAVRAMLLQAEAGAESRHPLPLGSWFRQRLGRSFAFLEACRPDGAWVHRSYFAH